MAVRDTYKYMVKRKGVIVYHDATSDLERRGCEHKARWPDAEIIQVGRKTTRVAALKWRDKMGRRRFGRNG